MKRISAFLVSIGLSAGLIALGIWFLASRHGLYRFSRGDWMPHDMIMGGPMGFVMILFWIVVIAALVLLISTVLTVRRTTADTHPDAPDAFAPDALEILKRRYAKGDIDRAEYEAMRRELTR
jgi:putative membrane protein